MSASLPYGLIHLDNSNFTEPLRLLGGHVLMVLMLCKLSGQVDQDIEVLKFSISKLGFPCKNDPTKLERLRLASHEIKDTWL